MSNRLHPDIIALHDGTWRGRCVHCGEEVGVADIKAQDVILVGSLSGGFDVCHARHVIEAYKNRTDGDPVPELVRLFGAAVAERMKGGAA